MYYGDSREEIKLYNILRRLDGGKIISQEELLFAERKMKEPKKRKFWPGTDLFKDGIERAIQRLKHGHRTDINWEEEPKENKTPRQGVHRESSQTPEEK